MNSLPMRLTMKSGKSKQGISDIGNTKKEQYRFEVPLPSACSFQVSSNPKSGVKDIFGLTEIILRRRQ